MLLVLGVLLAGGCAGQSATPEHAGETDPGLRVIGLEARQWRVAAVGGALYRALATFAVEDETPGPWREAGIMFVRVPLDEIDPIESTLPHVDAIRRAALGQPTTWTPLASAPLSPGKRVAIPGGEHETGRVELLVRGWREPMVRGGVSFRVELALARLPPGPRLGSARPEVLDHLFVSLTVEQDEALVIVAAPPEVDFVALSEPVSDRPDPDPVVEPGSSVGDAGVAPLPTPAGADDAASPPESTAGPRPPAPISIGELLFVTPALLGDRPAPAMLDALVLIPGRD